MLGHVSTLSMIFLQRDLSLPSRDDASNSVSKPWSSTKCLMKAADQRTPQLRHDSS